MSLIYVAAPYSHVDPAVVASRVNAFTNTMRELIALGHHPVSPLMNHLLAETGMEFPLTWDYWADFSKKLLTRCDRLCVLILPGWEESTGVQAEITIAKDHGIPVGFWIPPEEPIADDLTADLAARMNWRTR